MVTAVDNSTSGIRPRGSLVIAVIGQREVVEKILHFHRHLAGRLCSSPPKARKNA